jgi:hypothetical protein
MFEVAVPTPGAVCIACGISTLDGAQEGVPDGELDDSKTSPRMLKPLELDEDTNRIPLV